MLDGLLSIFVYAVSFRSACRIKRSIGASSILLLLPLVCPAEELETPPTAWETLRQHVRGELRLGLFQYFEATPLDKDLTRFDADLKLEISGNINADLSYLVRPHFHLDNLGQNNGVIDGLRETNTNRYIANLDEAYLGYALKNADLRVGKQIFRWGTADFYNPMDRLNPRDYLDVPTYYKIGVPAVSLSYGTEALGLDVVFEPWFTPSRIPGLNNRWLGDFSAAQANFGDLALIPGGRDMPPNTAGQFQGGFRAGSSRLLKGWDLFLSYFNGFDPVGVLKGAPLPGGAALAAQVFQRYHQLAAAFSTTHWDTEFHGEAAARFADDPRQDDDYIEYVAGLNHTFDDLPVDFIEEATLVLEYLDTQVFRPKPFGNEYAPTGQYVRPFHNTLAAKLILKFNEDTSLELAGGEDVVKNDAFGQFQIVHKPLDDLRIKFGADIFTGDNTTFFGRWTRNDRVFSVLTYTF